MMKKSLLKEKIKKIVNSCDPIGLLVGGAPEDEYSPEIDKIVPLLQQATDVDQLHDSIYGIFVDMFDEKTAGPKGNYRKFSEELFSLRQYI